MNDIKPIEAPAECETCGSTDVELEDLGGFAYPVLGYHCKVCHFCRSLWPAGDPVIL